MNDYFFPGILLLVGALGQQTVHLSTQLAESLHRFRCEFSEQLAVVLLQSQRRRFLGLVQFDEFCFGLSTRLFVYRATELSSKM